MEIPTQCIFLSAFNFIKESSDQITAIEYLTVIFCRLAFSTLSRPFEKINDGRGFLDFRKLAPHIKTNKVNLNDQ